MRPIRLLKVEGFGANPATTAQWLAGLADQLQRAIPTLTIVSTTWDRVAPADLAVDAVLGHSYGIAGTVRAVQNVARPLPLLLALDPVPRWAWGQFPGWSLPLAVDACITWYQRNLAPCGEPFSRAPSSPQRLVQIDLSSRGLLHTTLPTSPEVAAHLATLLTALADFPTPCPPSREFSHKE